jgi:hypothetical protein
MVSELQTRTMLLQCYSDTHLAALKGGTQSTRQLARTDALTDWPMPFIFRFRLLRLWLCLPQERCAGCVLISTTSRKSMICGHEI